MPVVPFRGEHVWCAGVGVLLCVLAAEGRRFGSRRVGRGEVRSRGILVRDRGPVRPAKCPGLKVAANPRARTVCEARGELVLERVVNRPRSEVNNSQ